MTTRAERKTWGAGHAFGIAFFLASAVFVPLMIYNDGYFLFLGDFNVQQIPFYRLAHEAVRNGEIFWNWHTDLGANLIGSYSFYLLFSPFFWLTLPFPNSFVPHLMAPLLILKTACTAVSAYLYIKRFVRDRRYAVLGSLLYAFSGWMTFNIFFNHFHEVAVFFPLLLVSLEELVQNNRKGFFAAMVAVNCLINYWFFIGEVVFVLLYVAVRIATGGWGCTAGKFLRIAFEAVLGLLLSMVGLLPSVMALLGNPRTGTDTLLTGWLMWIYGFNQRLPAIIQSFFFPPEMPSHPNFFPDMGAKWASLSAWLPMFSTVGVIAYCQNRKRDFHKRMIVLSLIMAVIPVFNAAFVLFNHSYYARWFYMPVLMMCVATACCLEDRRNMPAELDSGFRWTAGFILAISLAVGCSPVRGEDGALTFGLYDHPAGFWMLVAAAVLCLLLTRVVLFLLRDHRAFERAACGLLSFTIVLFTLSYLSAGKNTRNNDDWFVKVALGGRETLSLPDDGFARSDLYDCMDNLGMHWGLPNIQAFHSIVPASIMEFYPALGIKRDVSSKPPASYASLRALLSVRWLFAAPTAQPQPPVAGFSYADTQLGYDIFENDDFLPMGFAYDTAVAPETAEALSGEQRSRHMLYAVELEDAAIVRNMDILTEQFEPDYSAISAEGLADAVEARRSMTADSFVIDRRGFTAVASFDRPRLLFFSVPYEKGWSATVNGQRAIIEKANIGFMAVRVPEGEATVRFDFMAPGLMEGLKLTALGAGLLALYLLLCALWSRRAKDRPAPVRTGRAAPPAAPGPAFAPRRNPVPPPPAAKAPRSLADYLEALDELPPPDETDKGDRA